MAFRHERIHTRSDESEVAGSRFRNSTALVAIGCGKFQQGWALRMTRMKNCPVELKELIQWLAVWKVNRELAFSAMPSALYSYFRQENIIDQEWELRDDVEVNTMGIVVAGV